VHDGPEDDVIERVARDLREPLSMDPALDARVMRAIRGEAPWGASAARRGARRLTGAWRWLLSPQPLTVSPLGALALAAGFVTLAVLGARLWLAPALEHRVAAGARQPAGAVNVSGGERVMPAGETRVLGSAAGGRRVVRFALLAPAAQNVSVVGDFNDWDPEATPLHYSPVEGVWWVVVPLPPGRYQYTFLVNGTQWVPDPSAPLSDTDFGERDEYNSVVTVSESAS
jgi:hypothetical protein